MGVNSHLMSSRVLTAMQLDPAAAAGSGEQQEQQQDEAQQQYAAWLSRQYSTFTGQLLQLCTASSSASLQVWPITLCRPGGFGDNSWLCSGDWSGLLCFQQLRRMFLAYVVGMLAQQQHHSTKQQVPARMLT